MGHRTGERSVNDFELRALYDQLVAARATGRRECLSPETIMRMVSDEATEAERLDWADHVAACPDCRRELDLASAVAEAGTALVMGRRRTPYLALAASVLILIAGVAVWQSGVLSGDANVVRGARDGVTLVAPTGDVTAAASVVLQWRAVERATRYDIEVMAPGGSLVYGTGVTDTVTAVPGTFLKPGTEYHWRVVAELADGRRLSSAAKSFRVRVP
jgi:hypothetical protein